MLRLYDWDCRRCGAIGEHLVRVDSGTAPPKESTLPCPACNQDTPHERRLSLPAPYLGEKVHNICVYGGSNDTMGYKALPKLPKVPGADNVNRKFNEYLAQGASPKDAYRDTWKDTPDLADYNSVCNKPEVREIEKERSRIMKENIKKRERARALKSGANINMRQDKCAGDPVI